MNTSDIEIFLCAAETLNFSKTAEMNFLSRQAVSRKIQTLEKDLNTELFDRASMRRTVSLTDAGEAYYQFFSTCRKKWDKLQMTLYGTVKKNCISVAYLEGLDFQYSFQQILFDAAEQFNADVRVERFDMHNIDNILRENDFDLVIAYDGPSLNLYHDYIHKSISILGMYLVVQKELFPQAQSASDCLLLPFATWRRKGQKDEDISATFARHCMDFGLQCDDVRIFTNRETARAAVESGHCIGICTQIDHLAQSPAVKTFPLHGSSTLACLWKKDNCNPVLKSMIRAINRIALK